MVCRQCGTEIADKALICYKCGTATTEAKHKPYVAPRRRATSTIVWAVIGVAVLVLLVLRKLTGSLWRSAFVAALFAWHPLHVESVAWVRRLGELLEPLEGTAPRFRTGRWRAPFRERALFGPLAEATFPNSQTVDEVAAVIAGVIDTRAGDVYTRAQGRQMVLDYFSATGVDASVLDDDL